MYFSIIHSVCSFPALLSLTNADFFLMFGFTFLVCEGEIMGHKGKGRGMGTLEG